MDIDFSVRSIKPEELKQVQAWAEAEGWTPGPLDVECYYNSDQQGFLWGESVGEPVGCIAATAYSDKFGFIAFFIVRPQYRGQGYGAKLMEAAMVRLGHRIIGVDSVVPQREFYKKAGFNEAFKIIRYAGRLADYLEPAGGIYSINEKIFSRLFAYEKSIFADALSSFAEGLLNMPDSKGFCAIEDGVLQGFGIMRLCGDKYKIGPLLADDEAAAEKLLSALINNTGGKSFFFDVPELNGPAMLLAKRRGLSPDGEVIRMYEPKAPAANLSKVFAIGIAAFT